MSAWPLLPGVSGAARFEGEQHRLCLQRWWGLSDAPFALHIGMNPSRAGADQDDLTVRKDQEFTRRLDLTRMFKLNIGTFISTDPAGLSVRGVIVSHEANLGLIRAYAATAARIIVATGKPPDQLLGHARTIFRALKSDGRRMECFGLTKDHWPKHSSRLAYATPLQEFRW